MAVPCRLIKTFILPLSTAGPRQLLRRGSDKARNMVATLADLIFTCRRTGTKLDILLPEVKRCFQGFISATAEPDVQCCEPFTILVRHKILQAPRDS
jgi:hypothetical protein